MYFRIHTGRLECSLSSDYIPSGQIFGNFNDVTKKRLMLYGQEFLLTKAIKKALLALDIGPGEIFVAKFISSCPRQLVLPVLSLGRK
jgi:hypothetical protein